MDEYTHLRFANPKACCPHHTELLILLLCSWVFMLFFSFFLYSVAGHDLIFVSLQLLLWPLYFCFGQLSCIKQIRRRRSRWGWQGRGRKTKPGAEGRFSGWGIKWTSTILACKKCFIISFFNSTLTTYLIKAISNACRIPCLVYLAH